MHSEMGPVRQNPIETTVRTAHLSVLLTVHNFQYTIQHRTVLIIPLLPPENHHSSHVLSEETGCKKMEVAAEYRAGWRQVWLTLQWETEGMSRSCLKSELKQVTKFRKSIAPVN